MGSPDMKQSMKAGMDGMWLKIPRVQARRKIERQGHAWETK